MTATLNSLQGSGLFGSATVAPPQEATPSPKNQRPNKFAGRCSRCGSTVEAGAGTLGPKQDGRWTVLHTECPSEEPPEHRSVDDYTEPVWPGTYTVPSDEGHRTFRVRTQAQDADFAPGAILVDYLAGPDNENDFRGFAFLKGGKLVVWKRFREGHTGLIEAAERLVADPDAALVSKSCLRCGRKLTTPASLERGIGPECAEKGW